MRKNITADIDASKSLEQTSLLVFTPHRYTQRNKNCVFYFRTVRSNLLSQRGRIAKSLDHVVPNPRRAFKI